MGEIISALSTFTSQFINALEYLFAIVFNLPIGEWKLGYIVIVLLLCSFIGFIVSLLLGGSD